MATQVQTPTRATKRGIVDLCDPSASSSEDDDDDDADDNDQVTDLGNNNNNNNMFAAARGGPRHRVHAQQHAQMLAQMPNHATVSLIDDDDDDDDEIAVVNVIDAPRSRKRRKPQQRVYNDDEVEVVEDHPNTTGDDIAVHAKDPGTAVVVGVARMPTVAAAPMYAPFPQSDDDDDEEEQDDIITVIAPRRNLKRGDDDDDNDEEVQVVQETPGARRRRRRQEQQLQQQPPPPAPPAPPQEPYMRVLEVFPDAQVEHVQSLLVKYKDHDVSVVIALLAEQGYPKADNQQLFQAVPDMTVTVAAAEVADAPTSVASKNFLSANSFTPSAIYKREVVACIAAAFPFLTMAGAKTHLQHARWHYAICHEEIRKAILGTTPAAAAAANKNADKSEEEAQEERQYTNFQNMVNGRDDVHQDVRARLYAMTHKPTIASNPKSHRRRHAVTVTITDPTLQEEVDYVQQQMKVWMETMDTRIAHRQAREDCKRNGTAVSCNCCFDEFALEEMIACREEGHLFCTECVASYAENQIFGLGSFGVNRKTKKPAMELLCMNGDECSSGFQQSQLRKALSDKILAKYDELQFQKAMDCANMDDMCACPKCGFQAALPETEMIFRCPVSGCRFESCRKCGEPSHIPLRCEEVEKQAETNGRVTVEEAISKAKIRTCPKCSKSFVKSDGCNKMTCPCGLFICYICRQQIKGYDHFCQTPHCTHENCTKCKLFSNAEEDDKRAMREAGLLAAELVRKGEQQQQQQQQQAPQILIPGAKKAPPAAVEVQVDVEKLLSDLPAARAKR